MTYLVFFGISRGSVRGRSERERREYALVVVRGRFRVEEEAADVSSSEVASGNARFLPLMSRRGSWIDNPDGCGGNVTRRALDESHENGRYGSRMTKAYLFNGLVACSSVSFPFPLLVLIARGRVN